MDEATGKNEKKNPDLLIYSSLDLFTCLSNLCVVRVHTCACVKPGVCA